MSKDCTTTLGYVYEFNRMCKEGCDLCPLADDYFNECDEVSVVNEAKINIVQTWADTHPEQPTLNQREYDFVHSLEKDDADITRGDDGRLLLDWHGNIFWLNPDMFDFLKPPEHRVMTVKELKNCKLKK